MEGCFVVEGWDYFPISWNQSFSRWGHQIGEAFASLDVVQRWCSRTWRRLTRTTVTRAKPKSILLTIPKSMVTIGYQETWRHDLMQTEEAISLALAAEELRLESGSRATKASDSYAIRKYEAETSAKSQLKPAIEPANKPAIAGFFRAIHTTIEPPHHTAKCTSMHINPSSQIRHDLAPLQSVVRPGFSTKCCQVTTKPANIPAKLVWN